MFYKFICRQIVSLEDPMEQRCVFLPNFYFACLVSTNKSSLNALAQDGRDDMSGGRNKTEVVGKRMRGKTGILQFMLKVTYLFRQNSVLLLYKIISNIQVHT